MENLNGLFLIMVVLIEFIAISIPLYVGYSLGRYHTAQKYNGKPIDAVTNKN